MNSLIVDIRETVVRAVVCINDIPGYHRTFPFKGPEGEGGLLTHPEGALTLPEILAAIRKECGSTIDEANLILPARDVTLTQETTPRVSVEDAEKIIRRKISGQTNEEFPPFSILPSTVDQKTQHWNVLHVPTATLKQYIKLFSGARLKLKNITAPLNAIDDSFRSIRESIFNAHAVFDIVGGYVDACFISSDGVIRTECLPYLKDVSTAGHEPTDEKALKHRLFHIIDTIFRIHSHFQIDNKNIPVQLAWVCGDIHGLDDIAEAVKEAMSIEVAIAPAMPTGMPDESGYVPLIGFMAALQNGTATTYTPAAFLKRFPLHKTYGIAIYALTGLLAIFTVAVTETEYRRLKARSKSATAQSGKPSSAAVGYAKLQDSLKKLIAPQFIFYHFFRDLANNLPNGVFLDNLEYHFKDDKGVLEATARFPVNARTSKTALLSRLNTMFNRPPAVKKIAEPKMTVDTVNTQRQQKITFTSEVVPLDTKK
ncbi:MAG TPA: hypothetical protein HPP76_02865 [Desulfuromonadales bacterium]|nr:hypothetical protein [Desulfuromonadales bacterium]